MLVEITSNSNHITIKFPLSSAPCRKNQLAMNLEIKNITRSVNYEMYLVTLL